MKTVILYGELAKRFGKYHTYAVKNAAEAIRALKANFRGFDQYMCTAHLDGVGFRVFVGREQLGHVDEIHNPAGAADTIRLVPVVTGSKSPLLKILLGVALVASAFVLGPGVLGIVPSMIAQSMGMLGASLIIGGVSSLLSKPPQQEKDKTSYLFNGPENTTVQGKPVPVGYGRMIVGSCVISAGIETHDETED